jgi:hypothetical protein
MAITSGQQSSLHTRALVEKQEEEWACIRPYMDPLASHPVWRMSASQRCRKASAQDANTASFDNRW